MMEGGDNQQMPDWAIVALLALVLAALVLVGCGTKKPHVVERVRDSVRTEVRYRTEYRRDTIEVQIPAQTASAQVRDTASRLETDYATSLAKLLPDGTLYHDLRNKAGERKLPAKTPVHYRDSIVYRDRAVEVVKQVPRPLTPWQVGQIWGFRCVLVGVAVWALTMTRRRWLPLVRRLV